MAFTNLQKKLIRLAYTNKEVRPHILPLIKSSGYYDSPEPTTLRVDVSVEMDRRKVEQIAAEYMPADEVADEIEVIFGELARNVAKSIDSSRHYTAEGVSVTPNGFTLEVYGPLSLEEDVDDLIENSIQRYDRDLARAVKRIRSKV